MKYLNSEELAKLIEYEGKGMEWKFYTFREIKNPPTLRIDIEGKVKNCTCKYHSIHDIRLGIKCRYIRAFEKWKLTNWK